MVSSENSFPDGGDRQVKQGFRLKTFVRKLRFRGSRYYCPICASNLKCLRPKGFNFPVLSEKAVVGGGYRLTAQCPVCKSTDRERLIYLYLSKRTDIFRDRIKLLHVAPEPGLSKYFKMSADIDYLTADISSSEVMVRMDITDIDYPDGSFDVIICNHVLEHIIDDHKAMRELCRILKPGGWGILQVPVSLLLEQTFEDFSVTEPAAREEVFGQSDHVRIYAMDYVERLTRCGFTVRLFNWWEDPELVGVAHNWVRSPANGR